jgi:hypothetical protein
MMIFRLYMVLSQLGFMYHIAAYPLWLHADGAALEKRYKLGGSALSKVERSRLKTDARSESNLRMGEERADLVISAGDGYSTSSSFGYKFT